MTTKEQILGHQVIFKDTSPMLDYNRDIRGMTGYIVEDCGYGIVGVRVNNRRVTADLFRDIERKKVIV